MKELVEDIAKALVDIPDQVEVREVQGEREPAARMSQMDRKDIATFN